jgi:hypothetical protein
MTHVPPQQPLPATHIDPQAPQLLLLVLRLTQMPPQLVVPVGHMHTPLVHVAPIGHVRPHIPQLLVSLEVLASHPSAALMLQFRKLPEQLKPQVVPVQVVVALAAGGQASPQPPQAFTLFVVAVSQPFAGIPSQLPKPALQLNPHRPLLHVGVAPETPGHARLHIPQCVREVLVLVSQPLVALPSQSAKPARHVKPQAPSEHTVVALARAGQAVPQRPQCVVLVFKSTSQPSASIPLQSPRAALVHVY